MLNSDAHTCHSILRIAALSNPSINRTGSKLPLADPLRQPVTSDVGQTSMNTREGKAMTHT